LKFTDGQHIMASGTQYPDDGKIATLVREKSHAELSGTQAEDLFVGNDSRSIFKTCVNVFLYQPWICIQQFVESGPFSQLAK